MKIISHRGNIKGPDKKIENNPKHILSLLKHYECEVDVWVNNEGIFLGHDKGEYKINNDFFISNKLWCHAKNLDAFNFLIDERVNCFFHDKDDFTLVSNRIIWTYPNKPVCSKSIIVDLDKNWKEKNYNCYGVCVDYILEDNIIFL